MRFSLLILPLLAFAIIAHAQADTRNILFILDVSGSMAAKLGDESKMAAAKRAFSTMLEEIPDDTKVGIEVYGHEGDRDCSAIAMLSPIQSLDRQAIGREVDKLTPSKGATPIADALNLGAVELKDIEGDKTIVLISDGKENCEGDPVAMARQIREDMGIDVTIHVIGFGVGEDETSQLEGIAETGGGNYYGADSADALVASLEQVQKDVTGSETIFSDDFEGNSLGDTWQVKNPDPSAFLIENSQLLLLGTTLGHFDDRADTPNLLELDHPLPDGDWNVHVRFTGEFKSDKENIWLGLRDDAENYIGAQLWTRPETCSDIILQLRKKSAGNETRATTYVRGGRGCSISAWSKDYEGGKERLESTPATLTLAKRGRSYHAMLDMGEEDGNENPRIYKTESLTSLRPPAQLAIAMGKWEDAGGEFLLFIDSVEIEALSE